MMFRAVQRLRDDETSGRVVVFARAPTGELMVGASSSARVSSLGASRPDGRGKLMRPVGDRGPCRPGTVPSRLPSIRGRGSRCCPSQATMLPALVLGDSLDGHRLNQPRVPCGGPDALDGGPGPRHDRAVRRRWFRHRYRTASWCAAVALVALSPGAADGQRACGSCDGRHYPRGMLPSAGGRRFQLCRVACCSFAGRRSICCDYRLSGFTGTGRHRAGLVTPLGRPRMSEGAGRCPRSRAAAQLVTALLVAAISGRVSLRPWWPIWRVAAVIAPITVLGSVSVVLSPWPAGAGVDPVHRAQRVVLRGALGVGCVSRRPFRAAAGLPGVSSVAPPCSPVAQWRVSRGQQNDGGGCHMPVFARSLSAIGPS